MSNQSIRSIGQGRYLLWKPITNTECYIIFTVKHGSQVRSKYSHFNPPTRSELQIPPCIFSGFGLRTGEQNGGRGNEDSIPWRLVSPHTTVDSSSHSTRVSTPATPPPLRIIIGRPSYLPLLVGLTMDWTLQLNTSLPRCTHRPLCSRMLRVQLPVTWRQIWIWIFRVRRVWVTGSLEVVPGRPLVVTREPGAQPAGTCTTWTSLWTVWLRSDTKLSSTHPLQPSSTHLLPQSRPNTPLSPPVSTPIPRPRVASSPSRRSFPPREWNSENSQQEAPRNVRIRNPQCTQIDHPISCSKTPRSDRKHGLWI